MSASEWIAIGGGLVLGFWLVTVFLPHATGTGAATEPDADHGPQAWHEVLGVAPDASRSEIIAAYRHGIRQYDPAAVAALPADARGQAEARLDRIDAAYREGLQRR